ncbi:MAG TPA: dipeptidase [Magnetospirillaceae bacterium]|nr:dipeptidase [Magnetospirillaceae bacterium]
MTPGRPVAHEVLHRSAIVVDGHCDSALDLVGLGVDGRKIEPRDLAERGTRGFADVPRLIEGGVTAQFFALFTHDAHVGEAPARTADMLDAMEALFDRTDSIRPALCARDVQEAKAGNHLAAFLAIEGGEALGGSLEALRGFYQRGVRLLGLTWNRRNALGRGAAADGSGGLTDFGREVVAEMERLGMIVDASHLSDEALSDLLAAARRPVVASHSNSRAVRNHRRNLSDAQAEGIAATGGLVAVTFAGGFVDEDPGRVGLPRLMDHVDRLVSAVGAEHVGLGSDFDGFQDKDGIVLSDCASLPLFTDALIARGYSERDVLAILGGNWMRVIREVLG